MWSLNNWNTVLGYIAFSKTVTGNPVAARMLILFVLAPQLLAGVLPAFGYLSSTGQE